MIWGIVKQQQSVMLINRKKYSQIRWKEFVNRSPDEVKPAIELTKIGLYQVYLMDEYLFHERSFEKNDHEYRINME